MQYGFKSSITLDVVHNLDALKIYIEFFSDTSGLDANNETFDSLKGDLDKFKIIFINLALLKNERSFQDLREMNSFWTSRKLETPFKRLNSLSLKVNDQLSNTQESYLKDFLRNISLYFKNDNRIAAISHTNTQEPRKAYDRFEKIPLAAYKKF